MILVIIEAPIVPGPPNLIIPERVWSCRSGLWVFGLHRGYWEGPGRAYGLGLDVWAYGFGVCRGHEASDLGFQGAKLRPKNPTP